MVLGRICTDWVASLPVWGGEASPPGLTPGVVAHQILLPRLAGVCDDLPSPGDPLTPAEARMVRGLMETERARLEPEIAALGAGIAYGLDKAREGAVAVAPDELTARAVRAVCSIDDPDPITDGELAAVVSAYLENRALADVTGVSP